MIERKANQARDTPPLLLTHSPAIPPAQMRSAIDATASAQDTRRVDGISPRPQYNLLRLQRTAGNAAVTQLFAGRPIQRWPDCGGTHTSTKDEQHDLEIEQLLSRRRPQRASQAHDQSDAASADDGHSTPKSARPREPQGLVALQQSAGHAAVSRMLAVAPEPHLNLPTAPAPEKRYDLDATLNGFAFQFHGLRPDEAAGKLRQIWHFAHDLLDEGREENRRLVKQRAEHQTAGWWSETLGGTDVPDPEMWNAVGVGPLAEMKRVLDSTDAALKEHWDVGEAGVTRNLPPELQARYAQVFDATEERITRSVALLEKAGNDLRWCQKQLDAYAKGVEKGAKRSITAIRLEIAVLEATVAVTGGQMAAARGAGAVGQAGAMAVAGGVAGAAEETGTQIGEIDMGERDHLDVAKIAKRGAKDVVTGFVAGVVAGKFSNVLSGRLSKWGLTVSEEVLAAHNLTRAQLQTNGAELFARWVAGTAASPFQTATGALMDRVLEGSWRSQTWGEFAGQVFDDLETNIKLDAFMTVATHSVNGKSVFAGKGATAAGATHSAGTESEPAEHPAPKEHAPPAEEKPKTEDKAPADPEAEAAKAALMNQLLMGAMAAVEVAKTKVIVERERAAATHTTAAPRPLFDPEVYKAVVKLARQALKTPTPDVEKFTEDLRLARLKAGLKDLEPEELVKVKEAWEEAKALEERRNQLLKQIPDGNRLDEMVKLAGGPEKLERLLKTFPPGELENILNAVRNPGELALMLNSVGGETGAKTIRQWIAQGEIVKADNFLAGLAMREGKELAETAPLTAKSVIIDSNTAISLERDALGKTLNPSQAARVAWVKSLPPGTELRVGNATFGELGSDALTIKGMPLDVARESTEYKEMMHALENVKVGPKAVTVGADEGFLDRSLIADAFFAKADRGVVPPFVTADRNVVKPLVTFADPAAQKAFAAGGYPNLVEDFSTTGGFKVTITLPSGVQRSLMVIPLK